VIAGVRSGISGFALRASCWLAGLGLGLATATAATVIVSDPFTDGSRTNAGGGDPLDLVYYMGQSWGTLAITNDDAGIGTGNALLLTPTTGWSRCLAYFGPVSLVSPGDSVTVSFDYRFAVAPTNINAGLRAGLYQSMGTRQSTDASDTGSGVGNRSDDVGYGFQTNPGTNAATATTVYSEAAANDILGGASPSHTANQGSPAPSLNSGTNRHSALFQISRQPNGDLALSAQLDGAAAAAATIPAASILTNRFDEFALAEAGTGFFVPLLLDNLTISTTAADDFDRLRVKWWQVQTGGTNYSLSDSLVKSRLNSISNSAWSSWNSMDKTGTNSFLWSDLTSTTDSGQISTAYARLRAMALAYATYGGAFNANPALAADIQTGLNWMYAHRYNEAIPATSGEYDNWYDWEIGAPLNIVDVAVFMYDALGLTGLSNTLNAVDHFVPAPVSGTSGTSTGGNLTDKIRTVALRGAVVKDASKLAAARDGFSPLFQYVTSGDGYYADGSFVQHTRHPYNGSYGSVALGDVALVLPWLVGSPWQCTDPAQTNVIQWVYNSYEPLLYSGAMMDMTRGRAVSRSSSQDHSAGATISQWLLTLAVSPFPAPADAARIRSMVKYWAQADTFRNFTNNVPLQLITPTAQLMADTGTPPRGELLGHWSFASMDQAVHLRPGWGLALCLSSSRIYNYESINGENLHGWFQGDGMTYLYNSDLAQFNDDFWPTVDPYRLPGTTVDLTPRADASGQSYLSSKNWVGGATLSTNAVAGMELDAYGSTLTAKKSWFMLDDEVVCLGAGITATSGSNILSTALNRKLSSSNTNVFVAGGVAQPVTLGWQTNLTNASWCTLGGLGGCYFPGGATVKVQREARTNSWLQINSGGTTTVKTNNFLTLWFDHGRQPANASYAYVLLPNYSTLQASNYALTPEITILENSANLQAVKETGLNVVAANFWNDGTRTADLITVNKKASVLTRETPQTLTVAVADPTQTNTGTLSLTLNRAANSLAFADPALTVTQLRPTIQLTANVAGKLGRSLVAAFNLQNSPPTLAPIPSTNLGVGLTLTVSNSAADPDLPYQTLSFSLSNAPPGAVINPTTGSFTWRPTVAQAGLTNLIAVVVADDGSPSLRATQTLAVAVPKPAAPAVSQAGMTNGQFRLQISGDFGPDYYVQASSNLADWTTVATNYQPALPLRWTDPDATLPSRFYRLQLGP
jgi:hyaluronate lyase